MNVIEIKPDKLRNHPQNAKVFGELQSDADCEEFVASIRDNGIESPLLVGPDRGDGTHLILSGHRRRQAAAKAGMKTVPCIVREDVTSAEIADSVWLESNRQRRMTTEQLAKWGEARVKVEAALAKARQTLGKSLPQVGRAKDIAAKEVGMSRPTLEKAIDVVHRIDELDAAGDTEAADDLRETLNTQSVAKAHRKVKAAAEPETASDIVNDSLERPVPARFRAAYTNGQRIQSVGRKLDTLLRDLREVSTEPGGEVLLEHLSEVHTEMREMKAVLFDLAYWTECPACEGKSCDRCDQRGWLAECDKGTRTAEENEVLGVS